MYFTKGLIFRLCICRTSIKFTTHNNILSIQNYVPLIPSTNALLKNKSIYRNFHKNYQTIKSTDERRLHLFGCKSFNCFHTTSIRYIHPLAWAIIKPILKFAALLSGRGFRKWWKDLPLKKKEYFLNVAKQNKIKIAITLFLISSLSLIYYEAHLEEAPITKRKRFMPFTPQQIKKLDDLEYMRQMEMYKHQILPLNHPATLRVRAVVQQILNANKDIEQIRSKKWQVAVINSEIKNAFTLTSGYIFVFTGMLKLCVNNDQLGTVITHEMAHSILNHGIENASFGHLLDLIAVVAIAIIWALLPSDSVSLITHWLYNKLVDLFIALPYNRNLELEADYVGLQLAARACFDVRESSAFWAKLAILTKTLANEPEIEFLSTHPTHESRSEYLNSIMDEAIKLRSMSGCPLLKSADPRLNIEVVSKLLEDAKRKSLQNYPKYKTVYIA